MRGQSVFDTKKNKSYCRKELVSSKLPDYLGILQISSDDVGKSIPAWLIVFVSNSFLSEVVSGTHIDYG